MKSKKGLEGPFWILVIIIILLVFLFIYSGVFTSILGEQGDSIKDKLGDSEKDTDEDGFNDLIDQCPNEGVSSKNEPRDFSGCLVNG
tara:strand:- start:15326 stop:15586 length:261 start_codon:yes stop_codon:yes gene_type:complete